ncbi:MAG: hypothetical protein E6J42_02485 [Chloroflexi bacterium]|nr:MAG: hypothetical protein E6J42_02485 [Chloroflexota bacterium]
MQKAVTVPPPELVHDCEAAVRYLGQLPTAAPSASGPAQDPVALAVCSAPDTRTPPQFLVHLRHPFPMCEFVIGLGDDIDIPKLRFSCIPVTNLRLYLGLSVSFEQRWNLLRLAIGDLSSTVGLAPLEKLTLEVQASQRKVLEQSTLDSTDELDSTESTTIDKEVVNVMRASSRTRSWHVDGSGSLSIGTPKLGGSLGIQAGVQESLSQSSQAAIEHISETTKKSAHSLKTIHKLEVRGVTEDFRQSRMTRVVKNPYTDRALSLNVFQLEKHYSVKTAMVELRPALFIDVRGLDFDAHFVASHVDFLRLELLDAPLTEELPLALRGTEPLERSDKASAAHDTALLALRFLFDVPNLFKARHVQAGPTDLGDPNAPATSFNANVGGDQDGLDDAARNDVGVVFTALNYFYAVYRELVATNRLDVNAVALAGALATEIKERWIPMTADVESRGKIRNVLDQGDFTEIFRRITGFLAMVSGMVTPLVEAVAQEEAAARAHRAAVLALERLLEHVRCNRNYYIQRLLAYLSAKTNAQTIIDFVDEVIERAATGMAPSTQTALRSVFDHSGAFLDRQQIIVPAFRALTSAQVEEFCLALSGQRQPFDLSRIAPAVDAVEVPADGLHLELAAGACILEGVPPGTNSAELSLHDGSFKVAVGG